MIDIVTGFIVGILVGYMMKEHITKRKKTGGQKHVISSQFRWKENPRQDLY